MFEVLPLLSILACYHVFEMFGLLAKLRND